MPSRRPDLGGGSVSRAPTRRSGAGRYVRLATAPASRGGCRRRLLSGSARCRTRPPPGGVSQAGRTAGKRYLTLLAKVHSFRRKIDYRRYSSRAAESTREEPTWETTEIGPALGYVV